MAAIVDPDMLFWQQRVQDWYPDLYQRTYFLPPVFMNRTQYQTKMVAHKTLHVTQPPVADPSPCCGPVLYKSTVREDISQVKVLDCLRRVSEANPEVMFIISQLNFKDYLGDSNYVTSASNLPRPIQLKSQKVHRGEFDILIIHRRYGILIGEIKAIGDDPAYLTLENLEKKVRQAIEQLQKEDTVTNHLMSDQAKRPRIQATVMLPNITRAQLQSVLTRYPQLSVDLCNLLHSSVDPNVLCLTSDDLECPDKWWQQLMTKAGPDPAMSDPVYLDLISRFSGPATTIKVACTSLPRLHMDDMRTEGEGVSETGHRFTRLVLHPSQLCILNTSEKLVYLTGPPGCGKSLVLVLKGLCWLDLGKDVLVVSTQNHSLAASHMIFNQMRDTVESSAGQRLRLHDCNLETTSVQAAATTLLTFAQGGELYVLCDEVNGYFLVNLITELHHHCPTMHLWAAAMSHHNRPPLMTECKFTEPLRAPPSITQEVEKSGDIGQTGNIYNYTGAPGQLPSEDLYPRFVLHSGQRHSAGDADECQECGRNVAKILQQLNVGGAGTTRPSLLYYKDVFLLTWGGILHDAETDSSGNLTRPASGLLQGVRQDGIPVTVVKKGDTQAIAQTAAMSGPDHVIATDSLVVRGLERKVVVWITGQEHENWSRLHGMSRCTAQLVVVRPVPP